MFACCWSLTLREMFGSMKEAVTGDWGKTAQCGVSRFVLLTKMILGKNCTVLSFAICTAHKNVTGEKLHSAEFRDLYCSQTFWGGQIKEGAVGKECGASGGEVHTGFWCGNLTEIVHLVHLGVDGRTILK